MAEQQRSLKCLFGGHLGSGDRRAFYTGCIWVVRIQPAKTALLSTCFALINHIPWTVLTSNLSSKSHNHRDTPRVHHPLQRTVSGEARVQVDIISLSDHRHSEVAGQVISGLRASMRDHRHHMLIAMKSPKIRIQATVRQCLRPIDLSIPFRAESFGTNRPRQISSHQDPPEIALSPASPPEWASSTSTMKVQRGVK